MTFVKPDVRPGVVRSRARESGGALAHADRHLGTSAFADPHGNTRAEWV